MQNEQFCFFLKNMIVCVCVCVCFCLFLSQKYDVCFFCFFLKNMMCVCVCVCVCVSFVSFSKKLTFLVRVVQFCGWV